MANRVNQGGGRPSKGERVRMMSRLSPAAAEAVRTEAELLNIAWGDVIANIVAAHFGLPPMATPKAAAQMKLTA